MNWREISCLGCGEMFISEGRRAKWCSLCGVRALAAQRLRNAESMLLQHGLDASEVTRAIKAVAPRGMVTRAEYMAGESTR